MSLSWILLSASLGLLLLAGALWWRFGRRPVRTAMPLHWRLSSRRVFSTEELELYRHLCEALPEHVVLAKLPMVRFCQPEDIGEVDYWYDLLASRYVSFAVCSVRGRVQLAIDLDGGRVESSRGRRIKDAVFEACRIRYLRLAPGVLPSAEELRSLVPSASTRTVPVAPRVSEASEQLSATVAERRRERRAWNDSNLAADSFFDGIAAEGVVSGFGVLDAADAAAAPVPRPQRAPARARPVDLLLDEPPAAVVVDPAGSGVLRP